MASLEYFLVASGEFASPLNTVITPLKILVFHKAIIELGNGQWTFSNFKNRMTNDIFFKKQYSTKELPIYI